MPAWRHGCWERCCRRCLCRKGRICLRICSVHDVAYVYDGVGSSDVTDNDVNKEGDTDDESSESDNCEHQKFIGSGSACRTPVVRRWRRQFMCLPVRKHVFNVKRSKITVNNFDQMLQITSKNLSKLSCQLRLIFSTTIKRVIFVPLLIGKHESSPFHVGVLTNSSLASIQKLINVWSCCCFPFLSTHCWTTTTMHWNLHKEHNLPTTVHASDWLQVRGPSHKYSRNIYCMGNHKTN